MTKLLVSVRNAAEAEAALEGGADLIDVKEPLHGSLGRASAAVLREVADAVAGRAPLSCALGELSEEMDSATYSALKSYHYAKLGLAGALKLHHWRERWSITLRDLPSSVRPVAVIYADGGSCAAPSASDVLTVAEKLSCGAVLVDTFRKDGRSLFDYWPLEIAEQFVKTVRLKGMVSVLAGAIQGDRLRIAANLFPDYVAVRSAVCHGDRTSRIDAALVLKVANQLAFSPPKLARPICPESTKKTLDEFA